MPWLSELLGDAKLPRLWITGLSWDSRAVQPGHLFFAIPGRKADGHAFIPEAVGRGAVAVVGERCLAGLAAPYIQVQSAREALARAACAFYGHPTEKLVTIGVTGTNGKTTVVHLLGQLLPACETLTTVRVEEEGLSCVTTPEAPDLQRLAAQALARGKKFFAFEASSIGLAQHRVDGTSLSCAVFTSFSRDHLDFHRSMEAYLAAKLQLFRSLLPGGLAVAGVRVPVAAVAQAAPTAKLLTYGIEKGDVHATDIRVKGETISFRVAGKFGCGQAFLSFPGLPNLENALAALAVGLGLGFKLGELLERLAVASLPPGRWTVFSSPNGAKVIVDFAHNPQALRSLLVGLRAEARRLIVVFGCSGEADQGKRKIMGEIAGRLADSVIITTDNPKAEDPRKIAAEIAAGVAKVGGIWSIILDRAEAIRWAVRRGRPGDCLVIAGKGHERFQHLADGAFLFSDLETVQSLVGAPSK